MINPLLNFALQIAVVRTAFVSSNVVVLFLWITRSVKEGIDDMMKYLANEPSVGLYFVQQHAQASMPNLFSVKVVCFINLQQFMLTLFCIDKKEG